MEIVNSMSVDTGSSKKASLAKMAAAASAGSASAASTTASTRNSSVSSMASMSSHGSFNSSNLNHALAMVNNQLDREQRKQDQEATRKLTLLRQRKISAVLKVRYNTLFENYSKRRIWILAFSANFCPIKTDLSGNTNWPQALGFQKLAKMDHFWHF